MRGDQIEVYKMIKGMDKVDVGHSGTRGHSLRIRGRKFKTMMRNYYSQRVVNLWNSLPISAVESESLNGFKVEVDIFLIKKR